MHPRLAQGPERFLPQDLGGDQGQPAPVGKGLDPFLQLGRGQGRGFTGDELVVGRGKLFLQEAHPLLDLIGAVPLPLHFCQALHVAPGPLFELGGIGRVRGNHAIAQDDQQQGTAGQTGQEPLPGREALPCLQECV